jgi:hypothetical protein
VRISTLLSFLLFMVNDSQQRPLLLSQCLLASSHGSHVSYFLELLSTPSYCQELTEVEVRRERGMRRVETDWP